MPDPKGYLMVPCGFTVAGLMRALGVDASDNLKVTDAQILTALGAFTFDGSGNLMVKDTISETQLNKFTFNGANELLVKENAGADKTAQLHTRIAGAWQKQPMLFGYSARGSEEVSNLAHAPGDISLTSSAVPAGEIWDVSVIQCVDVTTATAFNTMYVTAGGINVTLIKTLTPAANMSVIYSNHIIMAPGDTISCIFKTTLLNDALYLRFLYVRLDIDL